MGEKYYDAGAVTASLLCGATMAWLLLLAIWFGGPWRIFPTAFWPDVGVEMVALD